MTDLRLQVAEIPRDDCTRRKTPPPQKFRLSLGGHSADHSNTMDWEGGTIGAIVPALMGHGEAGRASP